MTAHLTIMYVSNNSDCDIVFYYRGLLSFHKKQLLQVYKKKIKSINANKLGLDLAGITIVPCHVLL